MNPFIPCPFTYGDIPAGGQVAPIIIAGRAPTVNDKYPDGYFWLSALDVQINGVFGNGVLYYQAGFVAGIPTWTSTNSGAPGAGATITGPILFNTTGAAPTSIGSGPGTGVVNIGNASGTAIGGPETVAGSITATGNITTTGGNLQATGVGEGLFLTPTVVAAAASPQTANGRVFSVTFSGVSIASGASQTFVINNSAITGTGTVVLVEWSGATAGSAVSIASQVSTAGTLTIIMTNGTSATMVTDVANITFTGLVLN